MRPLTRRRFVQGAAGAAGMLTVAGGLRYLEDASEASAGVVGGQALEFPPVTRTTATERADTWYGSWTDASA